MASSNGTAFSSSVTGGPCGRRRPRWTSDPATADDVVSDVFLTAWRRIEDIPVDRELPWLYSVARRNVISNTRRSQTRRDSGLMARLQSDRLNPTTTYYDHGATGDDDRLERVWAALDQLSESDQEARTCDMGTADPR